MNSLYKVDREQYPNPYDVFKSIASIGTSSPVLYNIVATIGWANIASEINKAKDELPYWLAGTTLSAYAINYINNGIAIKLSNTFLEQGTECIKQLTEKKIDMSFNLSDNQKKAEKEWYNMFLDIWKEHVKEELKTKGLLLEL